MLRLPAPEQRQRRSELFDSCGGTNSALEKLAEERPEAAGPETAVGLVGVAITPPYMRSPEGRTDAPRELAPAA